VPLVPVFLTGNWVGATLGRIAPAAGETDASGVGLTSGKRIKSKEGSGDGSSLDEPPPLLDEALPLPVLELRDFVDDLAAGEGLTGISSPFNPRDEVPLLPDPVPPGIPLLPEVAVFDPSVATELPSDPGKPAPLVLGPIAGPSWSAWANNKALEGAAKAPA